MWEKKKNKPKQHKTPTNNNKSPGGVNETQLNRNLFNIPVHKIKSLNVFSRRKHTCGTHDTIRLPKAMLVSGKTQNGERWNVEFQRKHY